MPELPRVRRGWAMFGSGADIASAEMRLAVHRTLEAYLEAAQREAALQSIEHAASLSAEANAVVQDTLSDLLGVPALLRAAGGSGRAAGGVLLSTMRRGEVQRSDGEEAAESAAAESAAESAAQRFPGRMQ